MKKILNMFQSDASLKGAEYLLPASRSRLLVGGFSVLLVKRLIDVQHNTQARQSRVKHANFIRKRLLSPTQIPIPYWKLFLQGRWLYGKGHFLQAVSCFEYASHFEIGEAFAWLSMIHLGGRATIRKDIPLAVHYANKAEQLCPQNKRIVFCRHFRKEVAASTTWMFPDLKVYKGAEITLTPPIGVDPDVEASLDISGGIRILRGQICFRQHEGNTTKKVLELGMRHLNHDRFIEAWKCFYLLTKVDYKPGYSWIAKLYADGFRVMKCLETAKRCRLKMVLEENEEEHGGVELAIARIMWQQAEYDRAAWFYMLADFHGSTSATDELLHLRHSEKPKMMLSQATVELERARTCVACSNYQKAEWHYLLAVYYGSTVAAAEVASMRDLIYYLEEE
jgi:tetratricopeptide (TPR) repeat protein